MDDPMKDLVGLIVIMTLLWGAWFFTGGPEREEARGGVFLKPLAPIDTGETYGSLPFFNNNSASSKNTNDSQNQSAESASTEVSLANTVYVNQHSGTKNFAEEYVEIRAAEQNKNPVLVSGWRLQNKSGFSAEIKNALAVLLLGQANASGPIFLSPKERAYVATGRSPIGSSFKENICSGYLEQFQNFYPPIQKQCPSPLSDVNTSSEDLDSECVSYIKNIGRCQVPTEIPDNLSTTCSSFITTHIGHNACVIKNQGSSNFYTGVWRVFLGLDRELWDNNTDTIRVLDSSGGVVDSKSY